MGSGRRKALKLLGEAAMQVIIRRSPTHEYRLVAAGALMSLADKAPKAVSQLLNAAQEARQAADSEGELQLRLAAVRGLVHNQPSPQPPSPPLFFLVQKQRSKHGHAILSARSNCFWIYVCGASFV